MGASPPGRAALCLRSLLEGVCAPREKGGREARLSVSEMSHRPDGPLLSSGELQLGPGVITQAAVVADCEPCGWTALRGWISALTASKAW